MRAEPGVTFEPAKCGPKTKKLEGSYVHFFGTVLGITPRALDMQGVCSTMSLLQPCLLSYPHEAENLTS